MTGRDTNEELMKIEDLLKLLGCNPADVTECDEDSHEGQDVSDAQSEPIEEDVCIEDLIRQARQEVALGITQSGISENELLKAHAQRLVGLVALIARITPLKGAGSELGFMRPKQALACRLKGMTAADVDMWELDQMQEMAEETNVLWEGENTMQGLPLARNALLYAVLSDKELREEAFQRAEGVLEDYARQCEQMNLRLV